MVPISQLIAILYSRFTFQYTFQVNYLFTDAGLLLSSSSVRPC